MAGYAPAPVNVYNCGSWPRFLPDDRESENLAMFMKNPAASGPRCGDPYWENAFSNLS